MNKRLNTMIENARKRAKENHYDLAWSNYLASEIFENAGDLAYNEPDLVRYLLQEMASVLSVNDERNNTDLCGEVVENLIEYHEKLFENDEEEKEGGDK